MMNVLVTGANGFIGRAVIAEISERKIFNVYGLENRNSKNEEVKEVLEVFKADVSDYQNLIETVKLNQADVIIHSAGLAHQFAKQAKEDFWKVNVLGTENIAKLAVALKVKHLILISSVAVYGFHHSQKKENKKHLVNTTKSKSEAISEKAACNPQGFYAQSKLESEKIAARICEENNIALTILRLATVIGEEDRGNVARLIKSIDRKRFVWIGKGENRKSLVYKGDVAKACLKIIGKTQGTEIFNVTAKPYKMSDIVSEISTGLKKKIPAFSISPRLLDKFFTINSKLFGINKISRLAGTVEKWLSEEVFSGEEFKIRYGFQAETKIREAIRREVESYKQTK